MCYVCATYVLCMCYVCATYVTPPFLQIDIVFEVDKGFYTAIVALAKMALRPIILTSNNPLITLPTDAEFLTLHYRPPKAGTKVL